MKMPRNAGLFYIRSKRASHAHINESLSVSGPENCRYRWRPLSGGFSVRQAHFLKGKDAMKAITLFNTPSVLMNQELSASLTCGKLVVKVNLNRRTTT